MIPFLLISFGQRHSTGNALDQIVSSYQVLHGGQHDEDAILSKCRNAISSIEKIDKEVGGDINLGRSCVLPL